MWVDSLGEALAAAASGDIIGLLPGEHKISKDAPELKTSVCLVGVTSGVDPAYKPPDRFVRGVAGVDAVRVVCERPLAAARAPAFTSPC